MGLRVGTNKTTKDGKEGSNNYDKSTEVNDSFIENHFGKIFGAFAIITIFCCKKVISVKALNSLLVFGMFAAMSHIAIIGLFAYGFWKHWKITSSILIGLIFFGYMTEKYELVH